MIINSLYILIGVVTVLAIMGLIVYLYKKTSIPITSVKAGPIQKFHALPNGMKSSISPFENFYHDGKKVNPKDYIICKVDGDCMAPRGINACDIVFIKKFETETEKQSIKRGDIVYIEYEKEGYRGCKIREVDQKIDCNTFKTLYYSAEGNIKYSSTPHKLTAIIGVVKMRFNN